MVHIWFPLLLCSEHSTWKGETKGCWSCLGDFSSNIFMALHAQGLNWIGVHGQKEKGTVEDEMVEWHQRVNGHEFEQTLGDGGQGGLACCSPWGCKELDTTEWLNNNHGHLDLRFIYRERDRKGRREKQIWRFMLCLGKYKYSESSYFPFRANATRSPQMRKNQENKATCPGRKGLAPPPFVSFFLVRSVQGEITYWIQGNNLQNWSSKPLSVSVRMVFIIFLPDLKCSSPSNVATGSALWAWFLCSKVATS